MLDSGTLEGFHEERKIGEIRKDIPGSGLTQGICPFAGCNTQESDPQATGSAEIPETIPDVHHGTSRGGVIRRRTIQSFQCLRDDLLAWMRIIRECCSQFSRFDTSTPELEAGRSLPTSRGDRDATSIGLEACDRIRGPRRLTKETGVTLMGLEEQFDESISQGIQKLASRLHAMMLTVQCGGDRLVG